MTRTSKYIDSKFGQLHYYNQGEGGVPLICFHMSPYSGRYYEKFQAEMAKDRLVICPDTPGYGGSDAPESPATMEELADAMMTLIDQYDQVDLLGFHTGVFIATEIALKAPEKVRKLILPGIPFVPAEKRAVFAKNYEAPRPYFNDPEFLSGKWTDMMESTSEGWDEERKIEMFGEVMRCGFRSNWGFLAVFGYEVEAKLPNIEQPVLVPIPDEMLAASTRGAAGMFQNATVNELPDIKADLFESCPKEFIGQVREFLSS